MPKTFIAVDYGVYIVNLIKGYEILEYCQNFDL